MSRNGALRLERDAWSMVKRLRQATNEHPPASPRDLYPDETNVSRRGVFDLKNKWEHGLESDDKRLAAESW